MFLSKINFLKTLLPVLLCALAFSYKAQAQQQFNFRYRQDVKVVIGTDTLKRPWNAGVNAPQYNTLDLNNDNQEDLVLFDRTTNKVYTYLAVNRNGQWQWQYAPEYEAIFPAELNGWMLLRDYNCDGRKDIFTMSPSYDVRVYRQQVTNGIISFRNEFPVLNYLFPGQTSYSNMYQDAYSMPAVVDIDNDGDLDILAFDFGTVTEINWYKNMRIEQSLPCDSMKFELQLNAWAGLHKCTGVCGGFSFGRTCRVNKPMHAGGYSILALDLDGDNDKDILMGEDNCSNLVKLTNLGTPANASMNATSVQTSYPGGANPLSFANYPAAFYEDVDFDGKKDLLGGPFLANNLSDQTNMEQSSWFYRNTGTSQVPAFSYVQRDFLQELDLGEGANPAFADVDADGDLDLIVGNLASRRYTYYTGSLAFFRNTGSNTNPIFKLEDYDYLGFSSETFRGLAPAFTDLNGDGALDLVVSVTLGSGSTRYILNTAQVNQPMQFNRANMQILSVGLNADDKPVFYDLDGDGDKDLLFGKAGGNIEFYRNTGSSLSPVWTFVTDRFGGIQPGIYNRYISLAIVNLDQNPAPELVTADNTGQITVYSNFTNNLSGTFTPQAAGIFNPVYQSYMPAGLGQQLSVAAADLDGDQKPELIVGSLTGGFVMLSFENVVTVGVKEDLQATVGVALYPNPATDVVQVSAEEAVSVFVYDLAGKKVLIVETNFYKNHQLDVSVLKPGMYLF
ncbi:MAG: T9SS type A sorting domain-containing protein, partial [Hymenobacteraceae bacterium]|nr:T9SS type A sorting domain-containing protein [Hymenobacteraceae bacterium]